VVRAVLNGCGPVTPDGPSACLWRHFRKENMPRGNFTQLYSLAKQEFVRLLQIMLVDAKSPIVPEM
jgi:hypothetical protein